MAEKGMIALPNKVGRILENVRAVLDYCLNSIVAGLGNWPGSDSEQAGEMRQRLVDMIVASSGEDATERVENLRASVHFHLAGRAREETAQPIHQHR